MSEHTKGRLAVVDGRIVDGSGLSVATPLGFTFSDECCAANARRLVACWNACDGIPTDNLEPGGFLRMNRADNDMVRHLERDRSELIEALRECRDYLFSLSNDHADKLGGRADDLLARFSQEAA